MALEQLINGLLEGAETEAAQVIAQAKKKASELISQAEKETNILVQQELAAYENYLNEERKKAKALAKLKARDKLVQAKSKIIEDFFALLTAEINNLPLTEYLSFLVKVLSSRSQFGGEVVLNAEDKKQLGKDLIKQANKAAGREIFTLSLQTHSLGRGLILKKGQISENLTVPELVKLYRQRREIFVAKELFSD